MGARLMPSIRDANRRLRPSIRDANSALGGQAQASAASLGGGVLDFLGEQLFETPILPFGPSSRDIVETVRNVPKSAKSLFSSLAQVATSPGETLGALREAVLGAPEAAVRGVLPESMASSMIGRKKPSAGAQMGTRMVKGELDRLMTPGKTIKEDPVGSLLDISSVFPVARLASFGKVAKAADIAKAGEVVGGTLGSLGAKAGKAIAETELNPFKAIAKAIGATLSKGKGDKTNRLMEALAGSMTGLHSKPLREERLAKRAQVASEGVKTAWREKPVVKGFEDILIGEDSLPEITMRVAETVMEKIPDAATAKWQDAFRKLTLKNPDDPIDFAAIRQRMFGSLRRKYGINATGFASGKTDLDFSTASPQLRDAAKDQQIIAEVVDKMDALTQRYKNLRLGVGAGDNFRKSGPLAVERDIRVKAQSTLDAYRKKYGVNAEAMMTMDAASGKVKKAPGAHTRRVQGRQTYTAEDMHDELMSLRKSQIEKMSSVSTKDGEKAVNDMVSIFRGELGQKLDGFNDMQRARQRAFKMTDAVVGAFGFKKNTKLPTEERLTDTARSSIEQLLSSKPTHAEHRQVVGTLKNYIKETTGKDFALQQAVARLRSSTFNPQGITRAGIPLGGIGIGMVMRSPETIIGGLLAAMTIANPGFNGWAFRTIGATQGVADKVADFTRNIRASLKAKGINLTDEMTIAVALERLGERQEERRNSFLGSIGQAARQSGVTVP